MHLLDRPVLRVGLWIVGLLGGGLLLAAAISTLAPSAPGTSPAVANAEPSPPRPVNATTGAPPHPAPLPTRSGPPPIASPVKKPTRSTGHREAPTQKGSRSTAALRQAGLTSDRRSQIATRQLEGAQKKTAQARRQLEAAQNTLTHIRSSTSGSTRQGGTEDASRSHSDKTLREQQTAAQHRLAQAQRTLRTRTEAEQRARATANNCQDTARRAWAPVLAKLAANAEKNQKSRDTSAKNAHDRAGIASANADQASHSVGATKTATEHHRAENVLRQAERQAQKAITNARTADQKAQRATQAALRSAEDLRTGHVTTSAKATKTKTKTKTPGAHSDRTQPDSAWTRHHGKSAARAAAAAALEHGGRVGGHTTRDGNRSNTDGKTAHEHSAQKGSAKTSTSSGRMSRTRSTLHAWDKRNANGHEAERHTGSRGERGMVKSGGGDRGKGKSTGQPNHSTGHNSARHDGNSHQPDTSA